jgi:ATP-binding cassette subfamily B protein
MLGLQTAGSGTILWNNKVVERPDLFFIPPHTAYTGQVPRLFSDTVKNNILLGIPENDTNIDNAVNSAVMERDIAVLENGLDTVVGTLGAKLSGGQIQRVAAARMFARDADLFIFDDISSALDIETEEALWSRLFQRENATCIAVSNKKAVFQHADNIIVLKDGKIEAQGKLDELLSSCGEFQRICL